MGKYYEYITIQGDTFDSISLDFFDTEHKTNEIMKENTNHIGTIIFSAGVLLKIPILENTIPSTLPPWKRGV